MNFQKIESIVAAPFTPIHDDDSLNVKIIPRYAHFLKENGVKGIFICGTTGEAASLTLDEKLKMMKIWADPTFIRVMLVRGTSLEECKYLAQKSVNRGFDAIAFLKEVDMDCGYFRLPIPRMKEDEYKAFLKELHQIGFYDWLKPTVGS